MDPKIQEYIDAKFKELTDAINFKFGIVELKLGHVQTGISNLAQMSSLLAKMIAR